MGSRRKNDLTKQSLIDKLRAIIDNEMKKPCEQIDDALVSECADFLMELEEKDKLSDAEIELRVSRIFGTGVRIKKKKRGIRALIIAACLAALLLAANLVAYALGYDPYETYKQLGKQIVEMIIGEESNVGKKTIIKLNDSTVYDSLLQFVATTELNMLYPTCLPNGVTIQQVYRYMSENEAHVDININGDAFDEAMDPYTFSVVLNAQINNEELAIATEITDISGYKCYIYFADDICQCRFEYNGNKYFVQTTDYNEMLIIVKNLEET